MQKESFAAWPTTTTSTSGTTATGARGTSTSADVLRATTYALQDRVSARPSTASGVATMNQVALVGSITDVLELRYTQSGAASQASRSRSATAPSTTASGKT
jgi:hypothetical protein